MAQFAVLMKGFTNGMTEKECTAWYSTPGLRERIVCFSWDGDLWKSRGSDLDEERGTSACFTRALFLIRKAFPDIPLVAFKRHDQVHKLREGFTQKTKYNSVEKDYPIASFGEVVELCGHASRSRRAALDDMSSATLNVVTAPSSVRWDELGILGVRFWTGLGIDVHYVTIGGGNVVNAELEKIGGEIDMLWRLRTTRKSPKAGDPDQCVPFRFETRDETLPLHAFPSQIAIPKWTRKRPTPDTAKEQPTRQRKSNRLDSESATRGQKDLGVITDYMIPSRDIPNRFSESI